jgi:hypothetical protein
MLEDYTTNMCVNWRLRTPIMHYTRNASNLEGQVLKTNIQIMWPFMHHHVWCAIQQVAIPIEHIMHLSSFEFIVLIIEIYLTQFYYNNKITDKTLLGLGKLNRIIESFQHGHNTRKPHHYLQITKQFQIMGDLSILPTSWCIFKTKAQYLYKTFLVWSSIEI